MIKATTDNKTKEDTFPKLMRFNCDDRIIALWINEKAGVYLRVTNQANLGNTVNSSRDLWQDFDGTLTLENE